VKLPLIGAPYSPPFCGKFLEGWHELRGTKMYVSRGIGTSILNVRLLCRPEIAIITVGG
jgi:predicted MPP superfamily phosphohydrolase